MRHALNDGILIDAEVGQTRDVDHVGAREHGVVRVHRKRGRNVQHGAPRAAVRQSDVEQQFVAAIAHDDVVAVKAVRLGDEVSQAVRQRIGITVEVNLADLMLDLATDFLIDVVGILVRRDHDLGGDVFRVVRHHARQIRRRCSHLMFRHFAPPNQGCSA